MPVPLITGFIDGNRGHRARIIELGQAGDKFIREFLDVAVLAFTIISNFVGCTTGSSLGFAPLRILTAIIARFAMALQESTKVSFHGKGAGARSLSLRTLPASNAEEDAVFLYRGREAWFRPPRLRMQEMPAT
jgi:hypothetical protein